MLVLATRFTLAAIIIACAVQGDSATGRRSPVTQHAITDGLRPAAGDSASPAQASQARLVEAYGKLPLSFEINRGQTDPRVKFLSRGSGYSLFLTGDEAVLSLRKGSPSPKFGSDQTRHPSSVVGGQLRPAIFRAGSGGQRGPEATAAVLSMRLVGANARAKVTGVEELLSKSNYFIGNDPKKWHTNVANYAKVNYANVYPGVDLVYYGNQRQLEYDFVVQPGADPRQISLVVESPAAGGNKSSLRINQNGDLVVRTDSDEVMFHKPVVYQLTTHHERAPTDFIDGKYVFKGDRVTFEVASYDKTKALVIDPALAYSTYLGGSNEEDGFAVAVDAAGNAYVTGLTLSSDFPTTPGAFQASQPPTSSYFVSKLNANGSALIYSTYLGGIGFFDNQNAIVVDASGNTYVTGSTGSSDFPVTPGAFQTTKRGTKNGFISKINPTGSALLFSTYLGGSAFDNPSSIVIDASGDAYVTGFTNSPDFPVTPGAFQTSYAGGPDIGDAFVSKLNAAGTALLYSSYLGGSDDDAGYGITVDASGNAYITGSTNSTNFPVTPGAFQTTAGEFGDAFITKVNPAGSALVYSTYLGTNDSRGKSIAVDTASNAFVTGNASAGFPTTAGAFQTTFKAVNGVEAYITKLNAAGSALLYSTYLGGSSLDFGNGIGLDASGNAYVTGVTSSPDFPITPDAIQGKLRGPRGSSNGFVSKLNAAGSALVYSTYLGGNGAFPFGVSVDGSGNVYVTGTAALTDFPVTPGAFQTNFGGGCCDAFVSKISFGPGIPFSRFGGNLLIDPDVGVFYLSGGFTLGAGGSINPSTEPVTFSVGSYSATLPPGSFVKYKTGYVYQKTVNGIFLCVFIKFTSTLGSYQLLVNRKGGTLTTTTSPVPVLLSIGDNSGTAQMKTKFD